MATATPPVFLSTDPIAVVTDMVAQYQAATGKTLYPAQIESLLVDLAAYREGLTRQDLQNAALQCLVQFATGTNLEALGPLVGVPGRLQPQAPTVPLFITIPAAVSVVTTFASGYQVSSPDGTIWSLTYGVAIPAGSTTSAATAQAASTGSAENGIPSGTSFSPLTGTCTVASTGISGGGSDLETDDQLRARIMLAPYGFSVAGPSGAYKFFALGANSSIVDAAVVNGGSGIVNVYPLCLTGLPSPEVIADVQAALNPDTCIPLCDTVNVLSPVPVNYTLEANLVLYLAADPAVVIPAAIAAAQAYIAGRSAGMALNLVGSQVVAALSIPGVYSVSLVGWVDQVLAKNQWANGTVQINDLGFANE